MRRQRPERMIRYAFEEADKQALAHLEILERARRVHHMPDEEAWETMLSYEDWLAGMRMPNVVPKFR